MASVRTRCARAAAVGFLSLFPAATLAGAAPQPPTSQPAGTPTAHSFAGTKTVGALFPPDSKVHVCTASVVSSRTRNLLVTAAHCIEGSGRGDVFVPGYHDGVAPFGSWTVVSAYAPAGWLAHQTPSEDFAFLVVAPRRHDGRFQDLQGVTGANRLGIAPAPGEQVTVPAYPAGTGGTPITCATHTYAFGRFPAFNCNPYVDGTSGAPWLHHSKRGWTVVGIIGGPYQGGCHPWTSYSPALGVMAKRLMAKAEAGAPPDTLPTPAPAC